MLAGATAAMSEAVPDVDVFAALLTAEGLLFAALADWRSTAPAAWRARLFLASPHTGYLAAAANPAIASGGLVL